MGFTWENDLHLYYRRAKASETSFGDATFHRERLARLVIDTASVAGSHASMVSHPDEVTAFIVRAAQAAAALATVAVS